MKTLLYLLLLSSCILSSCSKDESISDSILGLWNLSNATINTAGSSNTLSVDFIKGCGDFLGDELCFSLDFKEDGTVYNINTGGGSDDSAWATYTIDEGLNTINVCDVECLELKLVNNILTSTTMLDDENIMLMSFTKE